MNRTSHILIATFSLVLGTGAFFWSQVHAQTLTITAAVLSKGHCDFTNNSATLAFGNLNPLNPQDVTVDTGTQLSFSCKGNGNDDITFSVTVASSENGTAAAPQMWNESANAFLPYELSLDPASGSTPKTTGQMPPVQQVVYGTVRGNSYRLAPVGTYTDTATIEINP